MTEGFDDLVDASVLAAVLAGPTSFDDLVCHLPGIYPTDVRTSLDRLLADGRIEVPDHDLAISRRPLPAQNPGAMGLSIPHPLDYDWRFSSAGLATILGVIDEMTRPDDAILCLGAPSIVRRLQLDSSNRPATLLDANPLPVRVIGSAGSQQARHCTLGSDPLPDTAAPLVVIDPPWYPEFFDVFLRAAAQLVDDSGYVLVSYPAAGTRPGVRTERDELLALAGSLGLELREIRRNAIGYRSPPFERAALEAASLGGLPGDWRHGDLLILRQHGTRLDVGVPCDLGESEWIPIAADPTQVRVRSARSGPIVDPRLVVLIDGDVLSTVSRRDSRRAEVDVWTANQRVYGCGHTPALAALADAVATSSAVMDAVAEVAGRDLCGDEKTWVAEAELQWRSLLEREVADLRRHLWLDET